MSRRDISKFDPTDDPDSDFERRLNAKLEERRAREAKDKAPPQGWAIGLRYGSEFIAGVAVGGGLGYLADQVFGWSPFGLLIGTLLGFGAGTLNVVRAANEVNASATDDEG